MTSNVGGRAGGAIASVIVTMHNCVRVIADQLAALDRQIADRPIEVIVVDDASDDGTAVAVRRWIDDRATRPFLLETRAARGGANAARNSGVARARADFLMFCDGDDIVAEDWIDAMLSARGSEWEILAGEVIPFLDGQTPTTGGALRPLPPRNLGFEYGSGGNMAMLRALYDAVGGFDERVFRGGTELEFAIRAQLLGLCRVRAVPQAKIHYRRPASLALAARMGFQQASGRAYIERKFGKQVRPSAPPLARGDTVQRLVRMLFGASSTLERRDAVQAVAFRFGRLWWRLGFAAPFRALGSRDDPAERWQRQQRVSHLSGSDLA